MAEHKVSKLRIFRDVIRVLFIGSFFVLEDLTEEVLGYEFEFESEYVVLSCILIFGTFWCGWFCPFGNVQCIDIGKARTISGGECVGCLACVDEHTCPSSPPTPFSPPSSLRQGYDRQAGPAQRLLHGPPVRSKSLADCTRTEISPM